MEYKEIRQLREKQNLTQIECAIRIGVSSSTYKLWELGGGKPKPENLKKLKEVLCYQETQ